MIEVDIRGWLSSARSARMSELIWTMADTKKVVQEEGIVEEALPATTFRVRLKDNRLVLGYLAGKMRMYHIKIILPKNINMENNIYTS